MQVTSVRIRKNIVYPNGSEAGADLTAQVDEGEPWERVAERLHLLVDEQIYRAADRDPALKRIAG